MQKRKREADDPRAPPLSAAADFIFEKQIPNSADVPPVLYQVCLLYFI